MERAVSNINELMVNVGKYYVLEMLVTVQLGNCYLAINFSKNLRSRYTKQ
jgi:hypothetical protein